MTAQERLQAARQAAIEGRHEEALEGLLWFHHHALEEDPSLRGVRLSYALSYWSELAKTYPPALQALKDLREQKAQVLLHGEGDRAVFYDVKAIDERLGDSRATYELYLALAAHWPELAAACTQSALPAIAALRDYALADRLRPDPEARIRELAGRLRWDMQWSKRRRYMRAPARWASIRNYAADIRLQTEISAGIGRPGEARRLAALAVDLIGDPSLRAEIRTALARPSPGGLNMAWWNHLRTKACRREARRQAA
jgi:hypothetical protein